MSVKTDKELALEWWETLSLSEQQSEVYYFCTGVEKGAFEFTIEDIVEIWTDKIKNK